MINNVKNIFLFLLLFLLLLLAGGSGHVLAQGSGGSHFVAKSTQTVTAAGNQIDCNSGKASHIIMTVLTDFGPATLISNPQIIAGARRGQICELWGDDTDTVTLAAGNGLDILDLSSLALLGNRNAKFEWDGAQWILMGGSLLSGTNAASTTSASFCINSGGSPICFVFNNNGTPGDATDDFYDVCNDAGCTARRGIRAKSINIGDGTGATAGRQELQGQTSGCTPGVDCKPSFLRLHIGDDGGADKVVELFPDKNGNLRVNWDSDGTFTDPTESAGNAVINSSGAALKAVALAANGANCAANQYPLGVDASGAVESCTADANTKFASVTVLANSTTLTWTDMPAAETEFNASGRYRSKIDLTNYTQARIIVKLAAAGATTPAQLRGQYSTNESTWLYMDGSAGPGTNINNTNTNASSWVDLAAGAKADVFVRVVGIDGDGVVDPGFGHIELQFR